MQQWLPHAALEQVGWGGPYRGWFRDRRGRILEALTHVEISFPHPETPPGSPQTYANKIAGINLRRPIGGPATYRELSKNNFYLVRLGHLVAPTIA